MNTPHCHLTPTVLYSTGAIPAPPLAILGTCIAEHLTNAAREQNAESAHYLMETWPHSALPDIAWQDYGAAVVHLTLRHVLDTAAGIGHGDIAYIMQDETGFNELTEKASSVTKQFIDQIRAACQTGTPFFFLALLEPPQTTRGFFADNRRMSIYRLVREVNDAISTHLAGMDNAYYLETNDITRYFGDGACSDSYKSHFTHGGIFDSPESDAIYKTIIQRVYAALHTLRAPDPVKLIITDLDNTLWKGVAAEEDEIVAWRHMEGWPIGYVEALLECKRRGILLAISSKNDEAKTLDNFKRIWTPKLQLSDFCSVKIGWQPKSENITEILRETNLLPDNVLFIDDNPLEIDEVSRAFPGLRTLTYPAEHWRNILMHSPQTQTVRTTGESLRKTELIRAKIARDAEAKSGNREDWLRGLELKVNIGIIGDSADPAYARGFELLNKTNQFNTTGKRWSEAEIAAFFAEGGKMVAASAEDKFANHGLIGLVLEQAGQLHQAVLSCRVFGLGIETCLLAAAMQPQSGKIPGTVHALQNDTGKNAASKKFYEQHGFEEIETGIWQGDTIPVIPDWIALRMPA